MPGDNVEMTVELIAPIAMEDGPALRDPRGWPHRRRRPRHEDREVAGGRGAMAKKEGNRPKITLACTDCKRRNYNTVKNRVNDRDRHRDEEVLPLVPRAHAAPRDALSSDQRETTRSRPARGGPASSVSHDPSTGKAGRGDLAEPDRGHDGIRLRVDAELRQDVLRVRPQRVPAHAELFGDLRRARGPRPSPAGSRAREASSRSIRRCELVVVLRASAHRS